MSFPYPQGDLYCPMAVIGPWLTLGLSRVSLGLASTKDPLLVLERRHINPLTKRPISHGDLKVGNNVGVPVTTKDSR